MYSKWVHVKVKIILNNSERKNSKVDNQIDYPFLRL